MSHSSRPRRPCAFTLGLCGTTRPLHRPRRARHQRGRSVQATHCPTTLRPTKSVVVLVPRARRRFPCSSGPTHPRRDENDGTTVPRLLLLSDWNHVPLSRSNSLQRKLGNGPGSHRRVRVSMTVKGTVRSIAKHFAPQQVGGFCYPRDGDRWEGSDTGRPHARIRNRSHCFQTLSKIPCDRLAKVGECPCTWVITSTARRLLRARAPETRSFYAEGRRAPVGHKAV